MKQAPELQIQKWLNTETPHTLKGLRGKVVVLHAFQMLCSGCIHYGTPQAQKMHERFVDVDDVVLLGIHTVFEHHAVMTPAALEVFISENRIAFPVGIDIPGDGTRIPKTMESYGMQGTPTLVLIDRKGYLRAQYFGALEDFDLGLAIGKLIEEPAS